MGCIIKVNSIVKKIKGNVLLDKITIGVNEGEAIGIIGRNGSGKSMFFKALTGLVVLDSGSVEICGKGLNEKDSLVDVGALIEYPGFLPYISGFKNLELLASIRNKASKADIVGAMVALSLDPHDHRAYKKYSLGTRQKLGIAAAIMESPRVLILDEPCNNLDSDSVEQVRQLLRDLNNTQRVTVLIASHDMADLTPFCSRIFEIQDGRMEEIP